MIPPSFLDGIGGSRRGEVTRRNGDEKVTTSPPFIGREFLFRQKWMKRGNELNGLE